MTWAGYCTKADVQADFKAITFGTTGAITDTVIDAWILQESHRINAKIGLKYVTPVDQTAAPEAFAVLQRVCIFRVSERVRSVIEIKNNATQEKQSDVKAKENSVRSVEKDLEDIVNGTMALTGVAYKKANGSVNSFNVDSSIPNVFDTTKQQW
jgi:hypothetical protein